LFSGGIGLPREIVLGNGNILVNLGKSLNIRDFYYPYVSMENHVMGHKCSLGVWIDGFFSWINQGSWKINVCYRPASMVNDARIKHNELGIEFQINNVVHYEKNIFIRKIFISNLFNCKHDLRLFSPQ